MLSYVLDWIQTILTPSMPSNQPPRQARQKTLQNMLESYPCPGKVLVGISLTYYDVQYVSCIPLANMCTEERNESVCAHANRLKLALYHSVLSRDSIAICLMLSIFMYISII